MLICFRELWREVNGVLVGFGQTICKANPLCEKCAIQDTCPVAASVLKAKKAKAEAKKKATKSSKKKRPTPSTSEASSDEETS